MSDPILVVRSFLAAIERKDAEAVAAALDPAAVQREWPNVLVKDGASRGRDEMLAGLSRGAAVLQRERYEILSVLASGDRVAVELEWTAVLNVPVLGTPAGGTLRGRFAAFFTVRDGKIVSADNYDCYFPSAAPQPAAT
jgi:ketosteroid isomerase-like protein